MPTAKETGTSSKASVFSCALGVRLRALREERAWSQRELGRRLGILQSKLSKYESGTHQPSLRTLVHMASLFSVSTDYLLTGSSVVAPPLKDERLLDRFRRLGTGSEEMRTIVLSILDAVFDLDEAMRPPREAGAGRRTEEREAGVGRRTEEAGK
jgi:transcriptional regulator with XRE-family HTH domain